MDVHSAVSIVVPQLSLHTPIGDLTISEDNGQIVALDWGWGRDQDGTPLLRDVAHRLHAYFDGAAEDFAALPIAPAGSAYRQRVWAALRSIPHGQTRNYREIAAITGGSARSVGQANGANPVPILIPCHRVVAVDGWGGYSGQGGVELKRQLLELETLSPSLITCP